MTAKSLVNGAAGGLSEIVGMVHLLKQRIEQIDGGRAATGDKVVEIQGQLASATRLVTGGTGQGAALQTHVGAIKVKLDELARMLSQAMELCNNTAHYTSGVEAEVREWAAELGR